jgi:hypothetical protein
LARHLAKQYKSAEPFPHVRLARFLEPQTAEMLAAEFPRTSSSAWIHYKHANENKAGLNKRDLFPPCIGEVVDELNSQPFVSWLSELTGIPHLIADPTLEGGGLHQSERGGFLNIHTDFSVHHHHPTWRRRVNLILYLNPGWQENWGGALEFWEPNMRARVAAFPPLLNHAVIFNTDERSLHGFPDPLRCPVNVSRKSLALYYYTEQGASAIMESTHYRARPNDSLLKAWIIRADTIAVDLYSRAKRRLGFSDRTASKLLRFLTKRSRPL